MSEGGIQVSISPAQSAFFAGEPLSVTIKFVNLNVPSPTPGLSSRSTYFVPAHRRGAHSVAQVSLTQPPASPRTPRASDFSPNASPVENSLGTGRKGHIGRPEPELSSVSTPSGDDKKKHLRRALSVSITPRALPRPLPFDQPLANALKEFESAQIDLASPSSPSNPLPLSLARDVSVLVAKSHPHARKNSVVDGGIYHPHEIVSTGYSLSLDPIAENASPLPPQTPSYPSVSPHPERGSHLYTLGQNDTMESVVRESITESVHRGDVQDFQRQPPGPLRGRGIGLGLPSSVSHLVNRRGSSTFSPPGAETLLWAYAQFVGTVELDKQQVPFDSIENLRRALRKRTVVGGGSMDISSTSSSRSGGMLSSLFSSSSTSSSRRSWLSSLAALGDSTNHDDQLPTFESQPSMLVVDLNLAPGESRSYTYTIQLPPALPPTFRGKVLRFSYHLVVGTSRPTIPSTSNLTSDRQRSRVMRVPVRVYGNVSLGESPKPYDLLWPAGRRKQLPSDARVAETSCASQMPPQKVPSLSLDSLANVRAYAHDLGSSTNLSGTPQATTEDDLTDSPAGCREAVEVLTRHSRKVSYDIAKDGEKVAVLTFIKPAYRLGESVVGAIEFNDPKLRSNVVKFSAMLEAHEALPAILRSGGRSSRRVHAEYHASFVGHLSRGVFSLDIPPDSTPTFGIVLPVGPDDALSEGGLEWKVRLCFLVAVPRGDGDIRRMCKDGRAGEWGASWKATDGVAPLQCVAQSAIPPPVTSSWSSMLLGSSVPAWSDGEVEETMRLDTVECEVPIRVWPSATLFKPLECHFDA